MVAAEESVAPPAVVPDTNTLPSSLYRLTNEVSWSFGGKALVISTAGTNAGEQSSPNHMHGDPLSELQVDSCPPLERGAGKVTRPIRIRNTLRSCMVDRHTKTKGCEKRMILLIGIRGCVDQEFCK